MSFEVFFVLVGRALSRLHKCLLLLGYETKKVKKPFYALLKNRIRYQLDAQ